jgi:hypothetical protein
VCLLDKYPSILIELVCFHSDHNKGPADLSI